MLLPRFLRTGFIFTFALATTMSAQIMSAQTKRS